MRRRRGGRAWPPPGRPVGRSEAQRAPRGRAQRGRSEAGRTCRRASRRSLELEHLAFELDLVAGLGADVPESLLELLVRAWPTVDAEPAVGAQDPKTGALVGLRPVDEESRQRVLVGLRRLGGRAELEQAAAEAF